LTGGTTDHAEQVGALLVGSTLTSEKHERTQTLVIEPLGEIVTDRNRTFSTVWHWAHLVLKILAPLAGSPLGTTRPFLISGAGMMAEDKRKCKICKHEALNFVKMIRRTFFAQGDHILFWNSDWVSNEHC